MATEDACLEQLRLLRDWAESATLQSEVAVQYYDAIAGRSSQAKLLELSRLLGDLHEKVRSAREQYLSHCEQHRCGVEQFEVRPSSGLSA